MDRTRQREIASKGGHGVPAEKRSFSKNRQLAAEAGRKGGEAVPAAERSFSQNRELAAAAGRKGGESRAQLFNPRHDAARRRQLKKDEEQDEQQEQNDQQDQKKRKRRKRLSRSPRLRSGPLIDPRARSGARARFRPRLQLEDALGVEAVELFLVAVGDQQIVDCFH